jgi:hypothetical protein
MKRGVDWIDGSLTGSIVGAIMVGGYIAPSSGVESSVIGLLIFSWMVVAFLLMIDRSD